MAKKATKEVTRFYFSGVEDVAALNERLMEYMGDENMTDELLMDITNEYDAVYVVLKTEHNKKAKEWQKMYGTPQSTRETIKLLLEQKDDAENLELKRDCDIMLVGSWIWVKGKADKDKEITRNYRLFLNGIKGFHWNEDRGVWQWHLDEGKPWYPHGRRRGEKLPEEGAVFKKYGMKVIETGEEA